MSYFNISTSGSFPAGPIETLSTQGGVATPPSGSNFDFTGLSTSGLIFSTIANGQIQASLRNYLEGTGTTVGSTIATTINFNLGVVPATYQFAITTVGFEATGPAGITAIENISAFTTGAAGTEFGDLDFQFNGSPSLTPALFYGAIVGNTLQIIVIGTPGKTIDWKTKLTYILVS